MVAFYLDKIRNREMTIDQVPKLWRSKVQEELDKEPLITS